MSSAAGLSAAKRRRGASQPSAPGASNTVVNKGSVSQRRSGSVPGNMPPVPVVLHVHEERLRRLEKLVPDDGSSVAVDSDGVEWLPKEEFLHVVQALHNEIGGLKQMVTDMQSSVLSNASAIKAQSVKADAVAEVANELESVAVDDTKATKKKGKGANASD